jgi:hypothetical protein
MVIAFGKDLCMAKSTFVGGVFAGKQEQVAIALSEFAKINSVELPKNDVLNALISSSMLVVQALWVRRIDIAFISTYSSVFPIAKKVLEKHDFNDVIYTYRSLNTNLYTQKTSKGRTYNLNKESLVSYLNGVLDNKIAVLSRGKTTKGKTMKKSLKNNVATALFNSFSMSTTQPQPQAKQPKAKPQAQKQEKTTTPTQKPQKWIKTTIAKIAVNSFHKIVKNDGTSVLTWIVGGTAKHLEVRDYKRVVSKIAIADIAEVYAYVRKGDR